MDEKKIMLISQIMELKLQKQDLMKDQKPVYNNRDGTQLSLKDDCNNP